MRVVSLLPSATEALCLIGGGGMLVGRSHECDHPRSIMDRPVLTAVRREPGELSSTRPADIDRRVSESLAAGRSLYRLDVERLHALRPELILTQDLCDVCSIDLESVRRAAAAMQPSPRVLSLNPGTFEALLDDVLRIAEATGLQARALAEVVRLRERLSAAADHVSAFADPVPTVFIEWGEPLFVAGHWTPQLIERAGGSHPLNPTAPVAGAGAGLGAQMALRVAGKSIRVQPEDVVRAQPRRLIVGPCGVGLEGIAEHLRALEGREWFESLPAVRAARRGENTVALVDGNQMFSRPGPRLVDAFEWLVGWMQDRPDLIPVGFPWSSWRPAPVGQS